MHMAHGTWHMAVSTAHLRRVSERAAARSSQRARSRTHRRCVGGVERSGGVERCGGDVAHFGGGAAAQAALCARSLEAGLHARQAGQLRGGGAQVARQKHLRARRSGGSGSAQA